MRGRSARRLPVHVRRRRRHRRSGCCCSPAALVGVALAAVVAVAVAHLGDEVHPAELGTAIGVYVAGNTLGGISGRLVPGLVEESTSWRVAVALLGVVALAAVAGVPAAAAAGPPQASSASRREHVRAVRDLLRDAGIVRLCLLAFLLMGGFVACYNYLTFRLEGAPLRLSTTVTSLLFLAYLAGTVSSPLAGRLSDRFGRRRLALAGIGVSLRRPGADAARPDRLRSPSGCWCSPPASSRRTRWPARGCPRGRRAAAGQAAAMYLLSYYLGSSAFGALIGLAYQYDGWPAAAAAIAVLFVARGGHRASMRRRPLTRSRVRRTTRQTASAHTAAPGSASSPGRVPNIRNAQSAVVGGVRNSSVLTRVAPLRRSTSR